MGNSCLYHGMMGMLTIAFLGCSQRPNVPVSDMARAKQVAEKVLDAWKSGASMTSLKNETPPIFVSEDFWRKNLTLASYQFQGDAEMLGPNVRFTVLLNYSDRAGKKEQRIFHYLVTTVPAITFFREEG